MALSPQERIDQIRCFNRELQHLEEADVLLLSSDAKQAVAEHHQLMLQDLMRHAAIDISDNAKSLSLGMRAFSLVAAAAIMVFLILVAGEIWPHLSNGGRVVLLIGASASSFLLAYVLHKKDGYGYYSAIASVAAVVCFAINLVGLGAITGSESLLHFCIFMALYAWLLTHIFSVALLLWLFCFFSLMVLGLIGADAPVAEFWVAFETPEQLFLLPLWLALVYRFERLLHFPSYIEHYLIASAWAVFIIAMGLVLHPASSELPMSDNSIAWLYRILTLGLCVLVIFYSIRHRYADVMAHGLALFILFIAIEFVVRLVDILPGYLLFLILGSFCIGCIWLLRRFHKRELLQKWVDEI